MGYLDVLEERIVTDPAGVARIYRTMRSESRRMRSLVEKLILLARLERPAPPKIAPVDVEVVARHVVDALAPLAGDGRIRFHGGGPAPVRADESELREAVKNIIDNALKYAPGSAVDVTVSSRDGSVAVEVADAGPGFSEEDRAHAFDRFYRGTTRGSVEGSGLGLAIAKRAVERARGEIAIYSAPDEGTRVVLTLPRIVEDA
jgi:signal transduction histidine kinase